jgi:molybdate transport system substrate-binding protein
VLRLAVAGLTLAAPVQPQKSAAVVTVSAAISLTDALEEAGRAYRASGAGDVRFNFAGSNVLARQILSGAPVDVFVSADEAQMQLIEAAGAVAPGTRVDLLGNHLAVVLSSSAPSVTSAEGLAQAAIRRIALGDPEAVPAGVYAKQYLKAAGVWDRLAARVVPVANVRAALTATETGSVDAAIVYASDLSAVTRARLAFVVTGPAAPRIVYPAAILARSKNRVEAERFLAFLKGPDAGAVFKRYRFEPLAVARPRG